MTLENHEIGVSRTSHVFPVSREFLISYKMLH